MDLKMKLSVVAIITHIIIIQDITMHQGIIGIGDVGVLLL
jgi:hypothetical protein